MKTEKKIRRRLKLSTIVLCMAAISLCLIPGEVKAVNDTASIGETINVGTGPGMTWQSLGALTVQDGGTANLYPGGVVYAVLAWPGGVVNIYGGEVTYCIEAYRVGTDPVITVYGTDFAVNGDPCDTLPATFTITSGGVLLTGNYAGGIPCSLLFYGSVGIKVKLVEPGSSENEVAIDIKPGGTPNAINLKSKGVVPVAILGDGVLELDNIDVGTVKFAGASPVKSAIEDVNGDGVMDMVLHFRTDALVDLDENSTEATLTGETKDGNTIQGTDSVKIVPSKK